MKMLPFLSAISDISISISSLAWRLSKSSLLGWRQNLEMSELFPVLNLRLIPYGCSDLMVSAEMFHNPLRVVPIWYGPACYCIRQKHLQRMDTVPYLNFYFLSTVLISKLPMMAVSYCDILYYKYLHCK